MPPHFDLLDDRTGDEMLSEAQRSLLIDAGNHPGRPLGRALAVIVEHMTEQGFAELMQMVVNARRDLADAMTARGGVGLLIPAMWRGLGLEPGEANRRSFRTAGLCGRRRSTRPDCAPLARVLRRGAPPIRAAPWRSKPGWTRTTAPPDGTTIGPPF